MRPSSLSVPTLAALALSLSCVHQAIAQQARFIPIPGQSAIPGRNSAFCGISGTTGYSGTRLSEDGRVVGTVVFVPGDYGLGYVPRKAARWTEAGGTVVISPELEGLYPVTGLSADGQIIYGESWRWTSTGGYQSLIGRLSNDFFQTRLIFGCSSDGRTVGGVEGIYPDQGDLFRWRIDELPIEILPRNAAYPQGYFLFNTISGDGRVVAGSTRQFGIDNTFPDTLAPVIINDDGSIVIGEASSQAGVTDLSRDGSIAVGYYSDGFRLRAFRWTAETGAVPLDTTLPEADSSYARAVNAGGTVVVGDFLNFGLPGTRAWIWRANTGFVDLFEDLSNNYGLREQLRGWRLLVATDISADGLTIVGQAINPDECEQAFLISLPRNTCVADIDQTGTLTIQDVFEFLNLYFAADPRADINQTDGVTLQDIFDFVTAFFVGCS